MPSRSAAPLVRRTVAPPPVRPVPVPVPVVVVVVVLMVVLLVVVVEMLLLLLRGTSKRHSQKGRRVMVRVVEVVGCCFVEGGG